MFDMAAKRRKIRKNKKWNQYNQTVIKIKNWHPIFCEIVKE